MWMIYAFVSAFFAGVTAILAKVGIQKTDSHLATALRTIVVLLFAWLMVFLTGAQGELFTGEITGRTYFFLVLSGLATGASWLCYFRALQLGDISKVAPVDKSSTVLTMVFSMILLGETFTVLKGISMACIAGGTYLMLNRQKGIGAGGEKGVKWLIYAVLSAVFASLTAILGKVGIEGINSHLGTAIRTSVVLVMAWLIVFIQGKQREIPTIDKRSWLFIGLSGLATGLSWLFYYRALQLGPASVVAPIDKLSILVTVAFAYFAFHEKLSKKSLAGLFLIVGGTLLLLV